MSNSAPTAVLSQALRGLIDGRRILAGVFTAFTLEPEFFEQEILPLVAGDELSQDLRLRSLQLQEQLRDTIGPIAVYYDRSGIRLDGAARMDVRYVPVRVKTGLFHPKLVLLLTASVNPEGETNESLIVGVLSANLTKGGWWSNLESAHFEVVNQGDRCGFRNDLIAALVQIRGLNSRVKDEEALEMILRWLRGQCVQYEHATGSGRLHTRLVAGTGPLIDFLRATRGEMLDGCSLEVISPFFDDEDASPLANLSDEFSLGSVRVFLPRAQDGTALCTPAVFDAVAELPGGSWARLPDGVLKLGKDAKSKLRSVHAKLYRFRRKADRYEAILTGSHNATTPAHKKGGNFEASFLIERPAPDMDSWLEESRQRPKRFEPDATLLAEDESREAVIPLQLAFSWANKRAMFAWDGEDAGATIAVESAGVRLFEIAGLSSEGWMNLGPERSRALESALLNTSIVTVVRGDDRGTILVQESAMSRKPSIIATFTAQDVLELWSRLTAQQRSDYLESHFAGQTPEDFSSQLFSSRRTSEVPGFFSTYAGIFHGFDMLRKQVIEAVEAGKDRRAEYLLLGAKHDSLPRMIDRVFSEGASPDPIANYLIAMCARQLLSELRKRDEPFFAEFRRDIDHWSRKVSETARLSSKLDLGTDGQAFVEWFEGHFLPRALPVQTSYA